MVVQLVYTCLIYFVQPLCVQVRGCLYNHTFHVVVSADESGAVCVWNVKNGQREGRFLKAHGDAKVCARASSALRWYYVK